MSDANDDLCKLLGAYSLGGRVAKKELARGRDDPAKVESKVAFGVVDPFPNKKGIEPVCVIPNGAAPIVKLKTDIPFDTKGFGSWGFVQSVRSFPVH